MRRFALVVAASLAVGGAVAFAQEPPEWNAKCGEYDCRVERVTSSWQLMDVTRDRRTLRLVYQSGGCLRGDGRATVTETRDRIEIAVDQGQVVAMDTPDGEFVCTADLQFLRLDVRLDGPVRGRRVAGAPRIEGFDFPSRTATLPGGRIVALVPRVLGLAARDARALLSRQGFEPHGARRGRVVAQTPAPGKRARRGVVRLVLSR
jgi:hypothetical protein